MDYFDLPRHGLAGYAAHKLNGTDLATEVFRVHEKIQLVDSPIEADLMAWLCVQRRFNICTYEESQCEVAWDGFHGLIIPQYPHGPYRLDFLIVIGMQDGSIRTVAVECDGHDFHERTKFQAARDKKRDRYLAANSTSVMRFTGSEIYADPQKCALEVLKAITQIHSEGRQND